MNSKTSKALEGSIKKWEKILSGKGTDEGRENCPLCSIFIKNDCRGCPVKDRTKFRKCRGSPYVEWEDHQNVAHRTVGKVKCDICKNLALKELEFLKSLLKEWTLKDIRNRSKICISHI